MERVSCCSHIVYCLARKSVLKIYCCSQRSRVVKIKEPFINFIARRCAPVLLAPLLTDLSQPTAGLNCCIFACSQGALGRRTRSYYFFLSLYSVSVVSACAISFPCVLLFPYNIFTNTNSVVVFRCIFLICFLLCCFAMLALFLLSFLCLAFVFSPLEVIFRCCAFFLCNFYFS